MRYGLIAGNGRFPLLALESARRLGHDVTVVAIGRMVQLASKAAAALEADGSISIVPRDGSAVNLKARHRRYRRRPHD